MSDTVGGLIDKICINEKRIDFLSAEEKDLNKEVINDLKRQIGWMLLDMARVIVEGREGKRPLQFKKNKIYDKNVVKEDVGYDFINLLAELREHNRNLWELEDERRDKSLPDDQRLKAADEISKQNKLRNGTIDLIDEFVAECLGLVDD